VPFAFTGKLAKLTVDLGESTVTVEAVDAFLRARA